MNTAGTPTLRDELIALGSATLYEASKLDTILPPELRPAWEGAAIVGRAFPVRTAVGDNLPLHLALELAEPGDVLVVDAGGAPHGYWGEVMTVAAQKRGISGLIIDGGVRDTERLEALGFPAFSRWIAIRGTVKNDPGSVGTDIQFGRVTVSRGDLVVADRDGIVVLPAAAADEIIAAARVRAAQEVVYFERITAGESTMDIYGFPREESK